MSIDQIMNVVYGALLFCSVIASTIIAWKTKKVNKVDKVEQESVSTNKSNVKAEKYAPVNFNTSKLFEFIKEAEEHTGYTGADKLEYVVTKYQQFALQQKLPFDIEVIKNCVNKIIDLTKTVNPRRKDIIPEV